MKLLLVNGSLRRFDACAEAVAREEARLREQGADTEVFWPVKTENLACSGCGACRGAGMCVADPRAAEFLKAAADCEALLFFVPVGLLGPAVDVKNFIERAAALNRARGGKPLAGKRAAAFPVGRSGERAEKQVAALLAGLGLAGCE